MEYESLLTKKLIWNIPQNKPSLVADDLEVLGIPRLVTHKILLARGIYKWLSVRRQLIVIKNNWKIKINNTLALLRAEKRKPDNRYMIGYLRGYLKAYEECRASVRELCHSDRWQAPDFDREANRFLEDFADETSN